MSSLDGRKVQRFLLQTAIHIMDFGSIGTSVNADPKHRPPRMSDLKLTMEGVCIRMQFKTNEGRVYDVLVPLANVTTVELEPVTKEWALAKK